MIVEGQVLAALEGVKEGGVAEQEVEGENDLRIDEQHIHRVRERAVDEDWRDDVAEVEKL